MTAMQRRKGHRFERELARWFRAALGVAAKRGWQSRGGGKEEPDVTGVPKMHIEAKRGKKPSPRKALAQAIADAAPGRWPVAIIRDDRAEAFVVMRLGDWTDLVAEWLGGDTASAAKSETPQR